MGDVLVLDPGTSSLASAPLQRSNKPIRVALLKGSWDLVTEVIIRVTILITPIKVLITLLTKSHDPPSKVAAAGSSLNGRILSSGPFQGAPGLQPTFLKQPRALI